VVQLASIVALMGLAVAVLVAGRLHVTPDISSAIHVLLQMVIARYKLKGEKKGKNPNSKLATKL
jgi:hypothetical protein